MLRQILVSQTLIGMRITVAMQAKFTQNLLKFCPNICSTNTIIADSSPSVRKAWTSLGRRTMTCEEVIARLPDELRAKIGTNARATVDSHHARLIDHKRQELQDLELEHQQAVEDLERTLRGEIGKDYSLQVPEWQESASPTRESMVLAVLSDFSDQDF